MYIKPDQTTEDLSHCVIWVTRLLSIFIWWKGCCSRVFAVHAANYSVVRSAFGVTVAWSLLSSSARWTSVSGINFSQLFFFNSTPLWLVFDRYSLVEHNLSGHGLSVQKPSHEESTLLSICGVSIGMVYCSYICSDTQAASPPLTVTELEVSF